MITDWYFIGVNLQPIQIVGPSSQTPQLNSERWNLSDDTLILYNPQRGLQWIEVTPSGEPRVQRTLSILPDSTLSTWQARIHVLSPADLILSIPSYSSTNGEVSLYFIQTSNSVPRVVSEKKVPGKLIESRLLNSTLVLVTYDIDDKPDRSSLQAQIGIRITLVDLSSFSEPVVTNAYWTPVTECDVSGEGSILLLTSHPGDNSSYASYPSQIQTLEISEASQSVRSLGYLESEGAVLAQHFDKDVLALVTQKRESDLLNLTIKQTLILETFSVSGQSAPQRLASLTLGSCILAPDTYWNIQFDGRKVCFSNQSEPGVCKIVDWVNAENPIILPQPITISGSGIFQMVGNRLFSCFRDGTNTQKVTMSLYDIAGTNAPTLISQIVSATNAVVTSYTLSWPVFTILPEQNGILVRSFEAATNGNNRMVWIDYSGDRLQQRGVLPQEFTSEFASGTVALHNQQLLGLSSSKKQFTSVNISDLDNLQTLKTIELAFNVDQVYAVDDYLLQIDNSMNTSGRIWTTYIVPGIQSSSPVLRVTSASVPDQVLSRLELTGHKLYGSTIRDGKLYLIYGTNSLQSIYSVIQPTTTESAQTNNDPITLAVLDLSKLPELSVIGEATHGFAGTENFDLMTPVWPTPDVLVWSFGPSSSSVYSGGLIVKYFSSWNNGFNNSATTINYPFEGQQFLAWDVKEASAPKFLSETSVPAGLTNSTVIANRTVFARDGLVYSSYSTNENKIVATNIFYSTNDIVGIVGYVTNQVEWAGAVTQYLEQTNVTMVTNIVWGDIWKTNAEVLTQTQQVSFVTRSYWPNALTSNEKASLSLDAGEAHNLLTLPDGSVVSWGGNWSGQLGDGTCTTHSEATNIAFSTSITKVAAGWGHSLALDNQGTVWVWGDNGCGQLGIVTSNSDPDMPPMPPQNVTTPRELPDMKEIVDIAAGDVHCLALKKDGTVWAWGDNSLGQLGQGSLENYIKPVQVTELTDIVSITAGFNHNLAVDRQGQAWVWGDNSKGQCGLANGGVISKPVALTNLTGVKALAGGASHSLALMNDGSVVAWGDNSFGQTCRSNANESYERVTVPVLEEIVCIATGENHNLALKNDGTVWVWGLNQYGRLHPNATIDSQTPSLVTNVNSACAIAAGYSHSVVLQSDGQLLAWGSADYGQLGTGDLFNVPLVYTATNINITFPGKLSVLISMVTNYIPIRHVGWETNMIEQIDPIYTTNTQVSSWSNPVIKTFIHPFLSIQDYADPSRPQPRSPVSLPGSLQGVELDGSLLFVDSTRYDSESVAHRSLDALAFDGVAASLVDSIPLQTIASLSYWTSGHYAWIYQPAQGTNAETLSLWILDDSGKFKLTAAQSSSAALTDFPVYGDLLVKMANFIPISSGETKSSALSRLGVSLKSMTTNGIWVPGKAYGVKLISFDP